MSVVMSAKHVIDEHNEGLWLARIRNARTHLSRSEARVADCVLHQP